MAPLIYKYYYGSMHINWPSENFTFYCLAKFLITLKIKNPKSLILAVQDSPGGIRKKKRIYKEYKSNREYNDEVIKILNKTPLLLYYFDISFLSDSENEADETIAGYAKYFRSDIKVIIYSNDKDFLQLSHRNVAIVKITDFTTINVKSYVKQKYDIDNKNIVDFFALVGDSVDNIPGVKGIGIKNAAKLINKYDNLNNIYDNIDAIDPKIKNLLMIGRKDALISKQLFNLNNINEKSLLKFRIRYNRINLDLLINMFKYNGWYTLISLINNSYFN